MTQKIKGVILSVSPYSENDAIVTMLAEEYGIGTYLVRGYKKTTKKLSSFIQIFSNGTFLGTIPKNDGLGYLTDVEEVKVINGITTELLKSAYLSHVGELLISAVPKNVNADYWYENFISGINLIENGTNYLNIVNLFEVQLLEPLGVKPNLSKDSIDGAENGVFDYSEKFNGIIESKNFYQDEHRLHVDNKVINVLRWYSVADLKKVKSFDISDVTQKSLQRVIDVIYDRQLGLKTRSKRVIQQIISMDRLV